MAILGTFIGIDKYADDGIRDLTSASRDALALWALFEDSIPKIRSTCLVNQDATRAHVLAALDKSLGAADDDDTVIISFAGHGTRDHRFVVHDTSVTDLPDTTLSMGDLARRFKECEARIILCIVDCCFSGGAPARVLEESPMPRDESGSLDTLAGKGRFIISASSSKQPALELPNNHGLLTKALIEVFEREGSVDVTSAIGDVVNRVRAEASRMGYEQHPVVFGFVEGGLVMPGLQRGAKYFGTFPEARGINVSRNIADLSQFGIHEGVVTEWARKFPQGLNDLQLKAVNEQRILDGSSLLAIAPTSAGKTFIGELAAARSIAEGRRAVFLLPYRALVNEKYDDFRAMYGERVGMRVIRCSGDYSDQVAEFVRGKYEFAFLTYEMFLGILTTHPELLNQIGLIVLDEAQFITNSTRGITVELILTYLLSARERSISPQLIALSAVIGNVNAFDEWLGCRLLVTTERPVPLVEGVIDRSGMYQYLGGAGDVRREQYLPSHSIQVRRDKPSSQDVIVPLVRKLVSEGEKVLVFRNKKGPAEGCAQYLARELGLPKADEGFDELPQYDLSTASSKLGECLVGGTAFHNSNLSRDERQYVERAFRKDESPLQVLVATSTVAAGINTPASTAVLVEHEFPGQSAVPYTVAEYKNMSGRAGRLGFKEGGRSFLLAENASDRERLFRSYVQGRPEAVRSSFDANAIDTWIMRLLSQVKTIQRDDVVRLLANTYGGFLAGKTDPDWHQRTTNRIAASLEQMIRLKLVEEDAGIVELTLLGKACGRSSLSFASAVQLVELLRGISSANLSAERVMALVQSIPEIDDHVYTPLFRKGTAEAKWPSVVSIAYGSDIVGLLQRRARDAHAFYARCKRAALLWDWIGGTPVEAIEKSFSVNPFYPIGYGEIVGIVDSTRFHLRSALDILSILFVEKGLDTDSFDILLRRMETGLPAHAIGLLDLTSGLARGEYLALIAAGLLTKEALLAEDEKALTTIVGERCARQIKVAN